jgi:hypothetical protein
MAQNRIEETFRTIAHSRKRGIPNAAGIAAGISGSGADLSASLSQAGNEIAQLRGSYQQQADLIKANTQALQSNTSGQGSHSVADTLRGTVSGVLGGAAGLFSPILSGLTHLFSGLFGGGPSQPAALPIYAPPPPISLGGILHSSTAAESSSSGNASVGAQPSQTANATNYAPQITVHVNAMDSQSFMDRSGDIASAVREAMLNNHPINGVVADL